MLEDAASGLGSSKCGDPAETRRFVFHSIRKVELICRDSAPLFFGSRRHKVDFVKEQVHCARFRAQV